VDVRDPIVRRCVDWQGSLGSWVGRGLGIVPAPTESMACVRRVSSAALSVTSNHRVGRPLRCRVRGHLANGGEPGRSIRPSPTGHPALDRPPHRPPIVVASAPSVGWLLSASRRGPAVRPMPESARSWALPSSDSASRRRPSVASKAMPSWPKTSSHLPPPTRLFHKRSLMTCGRHALFPNTPGRQRLRLAWRKWVVTGLAGLHTFWHYCLTRPTWTELPQADLPVQPDAIQNHCSRVMCSRRHRFAPASWIRT
jgi:hypothetical protein